LQRERAPTWRAWETSRFQGWARFATKQSICHRWGPRSTRLATRLRAKVTPCAPQWTGWRPHGRRRSCRGRRPTGGGTCRIPQGHRTEEALPTGPTPALPLLPLHRWLLAIATASKRCRSTRGVHPPVRSTTVLPTCASATARPCRPPHRWRKRPPARLAQLYLPLLLRLNRRQPAQQITQLPPPPLLQRNRQQTLQQNRHRHRQRHQLSTGSTTGTATTYPKPRPSSREPVTPTGVW